jgi:hypothetical protein
VRGGLVSSLPLLTKGAFYKGACTLRQFHVWSISLSLERRFGQNGTKYSCHFSVEIQGLVWCQVVFSPSHGKRGVLNTRVCL